MFNDEALAKELEDRSGVSRIASRIARMAVSFFVSTTAVVKKAVVGAVVAVAAVIAAVSTTAVVDKAVGNDSCFTMVMASCFWAPQQNRNYHHILFVSYVLSLSFLFLLVVVMLLLSLLLSYRMYCSHCLNC